MKKQKVIMSTNATITIFVLAVMLAVLVPAGLIGGIFAGLHISSKSTNEHMTHIQYGYSDKKEDWHPGFGSGLGYCEYYYDSDEYNQKYKRNGYYNDVKQEDIDLICSYLEDFSNCKQDVKLTTKMIDIDDRFDIVYADEYDKYMFYYVYYYDMQTRTLFELWYDD